MYERFTPFTLNARKLMQMANEEARRYNQEYVGTEHILLGLIKLGSRCDAGQLVCDLGHDLRMLQKEVEKNIRAAPDRDVMGKLPLTPRAKKVIEYAMEEAWSLNDTWVRTPHLLLGLLQESEGLAAQVLTRANMTVEQVGEKLSKASLSQGFSGGTDIALAGVLRNFINSVFAEHAVAPYIGFLSRRRLSADKIRQAVLQSLLEAMRQGQVTEADLQE